MASLKMLLKKRIIDNVIEDAKSKMDKKYSLIVADNTTIKILHHCFKMHELNDLNIGVVVNVAYNRERVRISPIYFLSGDFESVQAMVKDYDDPRKSRYAAPVHVYFVAPIEPRSMTLIKESPIRKYLATFTELPCDFLVLERRIFSLNRNEAFGTLYLHSPDKRVDELSRTAQQLLGICLTLNEDPYIRFSESSRPAKQLAQLLDKRFGQIRSQLGSWKPRESRGTVIILDRSDDVITPLLHDMSYQCMVMDLLHDIINPPGSSLGKTDEEKKESQFIELPGEDDHVWRKYRHTFFGDVTSLLPKDFDEWRNNSAVAQFKKARQSNNESASTSKTLLAAAKDMPQYQRQIKRYQTNIDLAGRVKKTYARQGLLDVISLEQDMVSLIDGDGKKCDRKKLSGRLSTDMLSNDSLPTEIKLRLFMLFLISQGGLKPDMRKHLMEKSGFSSLDQRAVLNMASLGVNLQAPSSSGGSLRSLGSSSSNGQGHKNSEYWKEMQGIAKKMSETTSLTRFTSYLEWTLKRHLKGDLKTSQFPWIKEPTKGTSIKSKVAQSYRKHTSRRPNSNQNGSVASGSDGERTRVIVYILGGASFTEMKVAYQLSESLKSDIFLGSTSFFNPHDFIATLGGSELTTD